MPTTEPNGERRAQLARTAMWVSIIVAIIQGAGASAFWLSLPEKEKVTKQILDDHELRIRALESDRGLLQRIDERTKSIQDDVKQLHADFSFRASGKPQL